MTLRLSMRGAALAASATLSLSALASVTADFENLGSPPALNGATGFPFAHAGNTSYLGVVWDDRLNVIGKDYRVDTLTPGPLYGVPHSGNYFIGNHNGADAILLVTDQVLLGAWFARNEYYGFGGGADQVTITAIGTGGDLQSLSYNLPEVLPGLPEIPGYFDTSAFAALTGISAYRIDRHERVEFAADWVADDFVFAAPRSVAEPGVAGLLACAVLLLRRRTAPTGQLRRSGLLPG